MSPTLFDKKKSICIAVTFAIFQYINYIDLHKGREFLSNQSTVTMDAQAISALYTYILYNVLQIYTHTFVTQVGYIYHICSVLCTVVITQYVIYHFCIARQFFCAQLGADVSQTLLITAETTELAKTDRIVDFLCLNQS